MRDPPCCVATFVTLGAVRAACGSWPASGRTIARSPPWIPPAPARGSPPAPLPRAGERPFPRNSGDTILISAALPLSARASLAEDRCLPAVPPLGDAARDTGRPYPADAHHDASGLRPAGSRNQYGVSGISQRPAFARRPTRLMAEALTRPASGPMNCSLTCLCVARRQATFPSPIRCSHGRGRETGLSRLIFPSLKTRKVPLAPPLRW